jgi:hypothetical protein
MGKICPKCKHKQDDPRILGCEKCQVAYVDETELVTSFTKDELKIIASFLLRDWRVYVAASVGLLAPTFKSVLPLSRPRLKRVNRPQH